MRSPRYGTQRICGSSQASWGSPCTPTCLTIQCARGLETEVTQTGPVQGSPKFDPAQKGSPPGRVLQTGTRKGAVSSRNHRGTVGPWPGRKRGWGGGGWNDAMFPLRLQRRQRLTHWAKMPCFQDNTTEGSNSASSMARGLGGAGQWCLGGTRWGDVCPCPLSADTPVHLSFASIQLWSSDFGRLFLPFGGGNPPTIQPIRVLWAWFWLLVRCEVFFGSAGGL